MLFSIYLDYLAPRVCTPAYQNNNKFNVVLVINLLLVSLLYWFYLLFTIFLDHLLLRAPPQTPNYQNNNKFNVASVLKLLLFPLQYWLLSLFLKFLNHLAPLGSRASWVLDSGSGDSRSPLFLHNPSYQNAKLITSLP